MNPTIELAVAVAASSAFPPVLSPVVLKLDKAAYTPNSGIDLQREPFPTQVVLTDGGVYDNLGLETAWKRFTTILISDAGQKMEPEADPRRNWAGHSYRILDLVDNQVRSLRKRQAIDSLKQGVKKGAYWGIRTNIDDYQLGDSIPCPFDKTIALARTPTRLKSLDASVQERLINWGYAVCDAAMRKHVIAGVSRPKALPYENTGVG